ncbi:MAG: 2-amino-4-hydroxy-6-hydroxymethyldihydropteridine diphosphokinase [Bacteroidales bacterium]|nr:2-amino-4-hydroxy-6-hydroxymethyldihydropteridine diphosphokinase [Bacteroidales bacterium]
MNTIYLLTGGNLNDRLELILKAKNLIIETIGNCVKESAIYESEPWGFEAEQNFMNQVLVIETKLDAMQVLDKCNQIENKLGRVRLQNGYASRTMDIDILFFNNDIIDTPQLTIPHAHLHDRRFTLLPLVELSPEYVHPKLKKSLNSLLLQCSDLSDVKKHQDKRP